MANGLSSKLDYLKSKSPDTPEEELIKILEANAAENKTLKMAAQPTLQERLARIG